VAVAQTVALLVAMAPFVAREVSELVAGAALLALGASFLADVLWLRRTTARVSNTPA
jgi:hypothetical protein